MTFHLARYLNSRTRSLEAVVEHIKANTCEKLGIMMAILEVNRLIDYFHKLLGEESLFSLTALTVSIISCPKTKPVFRNLKL